MISFVVPAHNEEALLPATLASIRRAADEVGRPYEVIVVDDSSTDATAELAREHGARVVSVAHRQIAATRNAGAEVSEGDWLVFVDADTLIFPPVLRATVDVLEGGAVGGGARVDFEGDAPLVMRLLARAFIPLYFALRLAAGCYVFCTREAFDKVGGFDEKLYASEEVSFSEQLKSLGQFVVVREQVMTSGRKMRTHSLREMLAPLPGLLWSRRRAFAKREGLDVWYGPRRQDPGLQTSGEGSQSADAE